MYFKGKAQGYETGGDGEIVFTSVGMWGKGGEMQAVNDWNVVQGSGRGRLAGVTRGPGRYVSTGRRINRAGSSLSEGKNWADVSMTNTLSVLAS